MESLCFLDVILSKKEQVSNYRSFLRCLSFIVYLNNEFISSGNELPRLLRVLPSWHPHFGQLTEQGKANTCYHSW